ncbi:MAG: hypothetical protein ACK56I_37635, partial [bacterium]
GIVHVIVGRDNLQWHPRQSTGSRQSDVVCFQIPAGIHGEANRVDRLRRNDAHAAPQKAPAEAEAQAS